MKKIFFSPISGVDLIFIGGKYLTLYVKIILFRISLCCKVVVVTSRKSHEIYEIRGSFRESLQQRDDKLLPLQCFES